MSKSLLCDTKRQKSIGKDRAVAFEGSSVLGARAMSTVSNTCGQNGVVRFVFIVVARRPIATATAT